MKKVSKTTTLKTLRQYWKASRIHKKQLRLALLNPVGSLATNIGLPFFATQALTSIFTQGDKTTFYIGLATCAGLLGVIGNRIGFDALMKLQATTVATLNQNAFEKVISRGMRFHVNTISGKLVADLIDYGNSYSTINMAAFTSGSSLLNTVIVGLTIIAIQSWQLGAFMLTIVLIVSIWSYTTSLKRSANRKVRHETQRLLVSHVSDSIVNAQTVKSFAQEKAENSTSKKLNARLERLRQSDWSYVARKGNNRIAVLVAGAVLLLVILNHLSKNSPDSLGIGLFAFTYSMILILRLFEIDVLTRTIEESLLRAAPMTELIDEEIEIQDRQGATKLAVSAGAIDFNQVTFHYEDSDQVEHVFKNFDLHIAPGEKIGLVGPSGGGKTTLTKILLRFDDIQDGSIMIDGQNIADATQVSLRSNIGYVPQEPLLFHRSIADNISYSDPAATDEQIISAAKKAESYSFIQKLPKQFDTVVGERGVKLSGGQRQRVAVARAMLKNAPILVLDEATSALDSESEQLVQKSIDQLMQNKTAIVIAHRLSTIQKMDRIIVLDNGAIVEEGTHKELVKKKNGHYARLWAHQSGGFLESSHEG